MRNFFITQKPYLIAELSANHNNDIQRAIKIIDEAKTSGADAIKFQTYTADTITLNCNRSDFIINDGLWKNRILYELYSEGSLPWEWHERLFFHAKSLNLDVISTPFDRSAVDFLETQGVDAYKIASFEIVDIPLIRKVGSTKKHVFISTGMASMDEISEAIDAIGHNDITLFHCISSYPAEAEQSNLPFLSNLQKHFDLEVGLSDHCIKNNVAAAAVALGAKVIEKHFTLNTSDGGLDDSFSQTPKSFKELRSMVDEVALAIQPHEKRTYLPNLKYRKSIYASQDINEGNIFNEENIRIVRPGFGLPAKYYNYLINKKAVSNYKFGDRILDVDLF